MYVDGTVLSLVGVLVDGKSGTDLPPTDSVTDPIRNADLRARLPAPLDRQSGGASQSNKPFLFPGLDIPFLTPRRDPPNDFRTASATTGALGTGNGVTINFENADIQTVAKSLLGDVLELNFLVDRDSSKAE